MRRGSDEREAMQFLETVSFVAAYRDRCEDRVAVLATDDRCVIVAADGAGGIGAGDMAADAVLRETEAAFRSIHSADQWADFLRQLDARIPCGESTAVIVDVRPYGIAGASVGDSEAWIIHEGSLVDLTANQHRKPLLGSGAALPIGFTMSPLQGVLLVATDGFCNYVRRDLVPSMIARTNFYATARTCAEAVRLPSGELWDDLGIVVARPAPRRRTRQRYEI